MSDSSRITIRLSQTAMEQMQKLVESGEFKNISDVVRTAIERFLSEKFSPPNVERVSVDLPKKTKDLLVELVESGEIEAVDMNDAIRLAVKEYVRRYISQAAENEIKKEIEKIKEQGGDI
ncbi:MAG: ribbon-helix-helix protein, CopG family [Euryarchaeota archaeon]|nr:ribbon-helix-helix protein, CopG family [Euryarchaeota archaeon]